MLIEIYGRQDCERCSQSKKKVDVLVNRKWKLGDGVQLAFQDMESVDGAAIGAFFDVKDIPTTVVREGYAVVARWDGVHPEEDKLRSILQPETAQA